MDGQDGLITVFGQGGHLAAPQMAARAVLFFFITLVLIRLSGRRSFGQRSAFDACITILLGAILSRAVVGANEVLPTVCAGLALVLTHRLMAWLSVRYAWIGSWMDGDTRQLVRDGRVDQREMDRALLSEEDLHEAARQHGQADMHGVRDAWLERSGQVSVVVDKR